MANEPGVGRMLGVHPPFVDDDDYHLSEKYDSAGEPEATGSIWIQPEAGKGYSTFATAVARKTDLPRVFDEEWGNSEDLLTGAPKGGDRPDNPTHPDAD